MKKIENLVQLILSAILLLVTIIEIIVHSIDGSLNPFAWFLMVAMMVLFGDMTYGCWCEYRGGEDKEVRK